MKSLSDNSNMDIDFLHLALSAIKLQKLAQDATGIQSIVTENKTYNAFFFQVYGNTIPIKDRLKELGFKYFKGVWGKNVKFISDSDKAILVELGVPTASLDQIQTKLANPTIEPTTTDIGQNQPVQPEQSTSPVTPDASAEPTQPKSEEDAKLDAKMEQMQHGIDLALGKKGSERVSDLMGFVDRMIDIVANMTDEAGNSPMVKDFMNFAAKFHGYSFHNQMLIWVQNRNATYVNGFKKWMEMGRQVVNWDKGIHILAPRFKKVENEQGGEPENRIVGFGTVTVYDVSDTIEIPNYEQQTGKRPFMPADWRKDSNEELEEVQALVDAASNWAIENNITVGYEKMGKELGGMSSGGKILINDTFKGVNLFSTMVHEIAHEVLHHQTLDSKERVTDSKQSLEIDAETTAFIVLKHYGFDTVDTPNYLALWKAKGSDIKKRRDNINKAVNIIIKGIDKHVATNIGKNIEEPNPENTEVTALNSKRIRRY